VRKERNREREIARLVEASGLAREISKQRKLRTGGKAPHEHLSDIYVEAQNYSADHIDCVYER
jgi:hypothetical protein